jgi:hypothetical protein
VLPCRRAFLCHQRWYTTAIRLNLQLIKKEKEEKRKKELRNKLK